MMYLVRELFNRKLILTPFFKILKPQIAQSQSAHFQTQVCVDLTLSVRQQILLLTLQVHGKSAPLIQTKLVMNIRYV